MTRREAHITIYENIANSPTLLSFWHTAHSRTRNLAISRMLSGWYSWGVVYDLQQACWRREDRERLARRRRSLL